MLKTHLFLLFAVGLSGLCVDGKEIAGYYASWKVYKTCKIEELDPNLVTILIYAFANIHTDGTIKPLDVHADITKGGYKNFNALKKQNPDLKTLLAIGGRDTSQNFSQVAEKESSRKVFASSALDYVRTYGFDGIDIDWEYPTLLGGQPQDKDNFPKLLKEVRGQFDRHGYLLTAAVAASDSIMQKAYNVPEITRAVHYINLMLYDMHSYKDGRTGANAPLYADDKLNVQYCTKAWLAKGANRSKLLLGTPAYGKTYTLFNATDHAIGANVSGPGHPGPRTKSPGTLSYDEILEMEQSGWTKEWSDKHHVPYAYKDDQWVGYDDVKSIKAKVAFAGENDLGGLMLWSVDMDDARGLFGPKFPLLNTIKNNL